MNWSISLVITLAVCMAICIVVIMMLLGGPLGVTSPIARYAGIGIGCALGFVLGQYVHKTYVAK